MARPPASLTPARYVALARLAFNVPCKSFCDALFNSEAMQCTGSERKHYSVIKSVAELFQIIELQKILEFDDVFFLS